MSWQRARFANHIAVAKQIKKPLIIHTRAAQADTIAMMQSESAQDIGGVMHCFTEDWEMAKQALDLGFYISISGIVTFKNALQVQDVAKKVPLDRLLIETDAPYLAPVPFRGKPNQPGYIKHTAQYIAELRGIPFAELAQTTTQNYFSLFIT
jgi:TatD DNase family protein